MSRPSIFESERLESSAAPLQPAAQKISLLFPNLGWDLKKAGFGINAVTYLAISLFVTAGMFILSLLLTTTPMIITQRLSETGIGFLISGVISTLTFTYFMLAPKLKILKREKEIDRNLEYMLRDMQIQLTAGTPLFDSLGNIAKGGYGECSTICQNIIREVKSGRSITKVLDEEGMLSPSDYLRRALWQIVNAVKTGSNVTLALKAISNDIRVEKENRIKMYAQELNLWGLIYMMIVVIMPSMGVTLLIILSSFLGSVINKNLFWVILIGIILFQLVFISIIRGKRPRV